MKLITRFLVPRYIVNLQNPRINIDILKSADRLTIKEVKKALHLPRITANAFLHAPRKYGGLDLFSSPAILKSRLDVLNYADCPRRRNIYQL